MLNLLHTIDSELVEVISWSATIVENWDEVRDYNYIEVKTDLRKN